MLKQSFIYQLFISISNWFDKIFSQSFLVNLFIKDVDNEEKENQTIFVRVLNKIIELLRRVFAKLKLDKLLDNSIFTKPIIWLSLTVFLTPFLPTMVCIAMILFTGVTLGLKLLTTPNMKLKYSKVNVWLLIFILIVPPVTIPMI